MQRATERAMAVAAVIGLSGCLSAPPGDALLSVDAAPEEVDAAGESDASPAIDLLPAGLPSSTATLGDTEGGSPYDLLCPPGRFITGLDAAESGVGLTQLRATCSRLQIGAGGQTEVIDSVYTAAVGTDTDAEALEPVDCSPGLIAVGFTGSLNGNDLVAHLELDCAPVEWAPGPVTAEPSETTAPLGVRDSFASGSGMCDAGRAAGGIAGQSGLLVDSFRLQCFELEARSAE